MNIVEACRHPQVFEPFLTDGGTKPLKTWNRWFSCLRALYGLSIGPNASNTITQVTKRNPARLPTNGFRKALFLTGRRSGKTRATSLIAVFEALLAGNEKKLAAGETGVVALMSVSKDQAKLLRNYIEAILEAPLLAKEVVKVTREGFELKNGIRIMVLAGDYRTVRGYTMVACIIDEIAFFGISDEMKVKSNDELVAAVTPALMTTKGKLISITSPYSRKGYVWTTYDKHFGNDDSRTLVLQCPSRTLNPTLDQADIDEAMLDDPAKARSEYYAEFRDDINDFVSRELIEGCVIKNREVNLPSPTRNYFAFVDMSGGRSDDHAIAIAHKDKRVVVIDYCRRYPKGQNPYNVVASMADQLGRYGVTKVHGDNYAAEWVSRSFQDNAITFEKSDRNKSQIYLELLPRLGSGEIELLDDEMLVNQLASLQRQTRSGGRDIVDHPKGGHDDLANAVAGVSCVAAKGRRRGGALRTKDSAEQTFRRSRNPLAMFQESY